MTYAESVTTSELGAFSWERTAANNSDRGTVGLPGHKPTANVVNAWSNNCCGDECMKVKSNSPDTTCVTMAYDARRNRTSVGCNEESFVKIRVMVLSVSNLVCDWGWNFVCLSPSQVGDLYNTGTKTCVMSWDCRSSTTLGNWHLTHSVAGQCDRRCSTLSCCPQKWQASFSSSVKCCFWRDCQVQCLFSVPWGTSLHCNDQCVKRRRDSRSDARPQCSSNDQRFPSSFGEVLHALLVRGVPCPARGQCLQSRLSIPVVAPTPCRRSAMSLPHYWVTRPLQENWQPCRLRRVAMKSTHWTQRGRGRIFPQPGSGLLSVERMDASAGSCAANATNAFAAAALAVRHRRKTARNERRKGYRRQGEQVRVGWYPGGPEPRR